MRNYAFLLLLALAAPQVSAKDNSLQSLFAKYGVEGCIVMYDLSLDRWIYSDATEANRGTIPASTFKILNSLIALKEKAVDRNETLRWDGIDKRFKGQSVKAWNGDMNLESAFRNSAIWFYVEISKRLPRAVYGKYLKECGYGNLDLSEKGDDFWNYGTMKVSPKNQVEFLIKLYKRDLPFPIRDMEYIGSLMAMASNSSYSLSGKSGWGIKDGKDIGWLIGILEKDTDAYCYATRIVADSNRLPKDFGQLRSTITLEAFRQLGIID